MKALIQKLVEAFGPSGYESAVRELIQSEIKGLGDEQSVDALGNLIVRKGSKSADGMRIMLSAHMDEIGLIVTHVDEQGFARVTNIGGVFTTNVIGSRVRFINGAGGVLFNDGYPAEKPAALDKCYLDLGATSPADCPVKIGDVAGFERPMLDLGKRLVAKSMDDRIACVILIEALRQLKDTPHEVYFVFSTQEEVGTRGATTAAYGIDPDLAIAIDVTKTGDTPKTAKMDVALGKGPAIKVKDSGMISDPRVVRWMADTAEAAAIPYQYEVLDGGSTDARAMQLARAGVPAGCISVACRYVHSPSEMVDYDDVQQSVALLVKLLSAPVELK